MTKTSSTTTMSGATKVPQVAALFPSDLLLAKVKDAAIRQGDM